MAVQIGKGLGVAANSGGALTLTTTPSTIDSAWTLAQDDIVLIVALLRNNTGSPNVTAGFTDISGIIRDTTDAPTTPITMRVFARVWNTGDATTWSVTFTGGTTGATSIAVPFFIRNSTLELISIATKGNGRAYSGYLGTGAAPTHPFFQEGQSLLLNFNGPDQSTTITDSSPSAKTATINGNVQIRTAQSKYGGSSGFFDGASFLAYPSSADFAIGTGDYTLETWVYLTGGSGTYRQIFSTRPTSLAYFGKFSLAVNPSDGLNLLSFSSFIIDTGPAITLNTWTHVALSRSGTTVRAFVNGVQLASNTDSAEWTIGEFYIGANGDGAEAFPGYLDDVRITKGVALYTANFTPPSAQLRSTPANIPAGAVTIAIAGVADDLPSNTDFVNFRSTTVNPYTWASYTTGYNKVLSDPATRSTLGSDASLHTGRTYITTAFNQTNTNIFGIRLGDFNTTPTNFPAGITESGILILEKTWVTFTTTSTGGLKFGGTAIAGFGFTNYLVTSSGGLKFSGSVATKQNSRSIYGFGTIWAAEASGSKVSGQFVECEIAGTKYPLTFVSVSRDGTEAEINATVATKLFNVIGSSFSLSATYQFADQPNITNTIITGAIIEISRATGNGLTTLTARLSNQQQRYAEWIPKRIQAMSTRYTRADLDWEVRPGDLYQGVTINNCVSVAQVGNVSFTQVNYG